MSTSHKIIIGLIILLLVVVVYRTAENMSMGYLDQMAMKSEDPTALHYFGRRRDIISMSPRDYYLEHQMLASSDAEPYYHDSNMTQFSNTTDYQGLNRTYRPRSSVQNVVLSDE